jgi:two-component system, NtrC family, nitrogen regulation sensor histidine kinase NtrY
MRIRRTASTSLTSLISLVLLYMLLIGLVLVFSNEILMDLTFSHSFSSVLVIVVGVLFPVALTVTIVLNIARLIRDKTTGRPGVRFKLRLLLFFFFIVMLSSVPQGILSINFIGSATNLWFSGRTGTALRSAQNIALQYYHEKTANLQDFAGSAVLRTLFQDLSRSPRRVWDGIRTIHPSIDSMQVFGPTGQDIYFVGQPATRLTYSQIQGNKPGEVVKDSTGALSFVRVIVAQPRQGSEQYLVVLSEVLPAGFDRGATEITKSLETFQQLDQMQSVFLVGVILFYGFFSLPLLLLSILVSFFLSDEIIRPIVQLEEATRRVADGDFSYRILSRRGDDLSLLVRSFNQMVSELERSRYKLLQTEKVAAWQEIAQQLAHEIKNPLTPIKLSAERILRKYQQLGSEEREEFGRILEVSVRAIVTEVDGLSNLLGEFRDFSRMPEPQPQPVNVAQAVQETVATYGSISGVTFHHEYLDPQLSAMADPSQLRQVLSNLFKNAIDAMNGTGEVFVRADLVKKGNSLYCRIQVQDTGPGIDPEFHDKVFNPYFTTKKHGTGLGLAIVERIVFDHRGQIWFETEQGLGTTFFIDLPTG